MEINKALAARAAPLPELEKAFDAFARKRAEAVAPQADFSPPDPATLADDSGKALDRLLGRRPHNVPALMERARLHIEKGAWQQARPLLEKAVALAPDAAGGDGPHAVLAGVYRKLGMAAEERRMLEQLADQTSDAVAAYRRLLEIAEEKGDRTLQAQERRAAAGGESHAGGGLARARAGAGGRRRQGQPGGRR